MSFAFILTASTLVLVVAITLLVPLYRSVPEDRSTRPGGPQEMKADDQEKLAHLVEDPSAFNGAGVAQELEERLQEIETERVAGLLDDETVQEAILEAKRAALIRAEMLDKMLPNRSGSALTDAVGTWSRVWRFAAIGCVGILPLAVAFTYYEVGSPGFDRVNGLNHEAHKQQTNDFNQSRDQSLKRAGRTDPAQAAQAAQEPQAAQGGQAAQAANAAIAQNEAIKGMVAGLAMRLSENPDDPAGWRMLARSQTVLGEHDASVESYRNLLNLVSGSVDDWRNFAAARATAFTNGDFPFDAEFLNILDEIEKRAPNDATALFYRGGALREAGDTEGAAQAWRQLRETIPPNAPILPILERLIAELQPSQSDAGLANK
ncbi:MAG: hypothetical protein AAF720_02945 [Pseudomonadota bacterium]